MNKLNVFIGILLIIFSLFVVNLNIKRYKSFELQRIINADHIFQNPLDQKSLDFINSIDDQYPSLNIFAMPLVSMKAQYLLAKDSIEKAIEYLELGSKNNPYLMFSESRLAEVYLATGDGQKAEYYIRKAFKGLPNNPSHFILMVKVLQKENKNDSIYYYYNKVKDIIGPKDHQIYNIVLASLFQDKQNIEKYKLKDIAKEAVTVHPNKMSVRKMADYVNYTQENVDLAAQKYNEAMQLINDGEFKTGSNILGEVIELHPNIKVYNDNYIISNYNLQQYSNITNIYNQYIRLFKDVSDEMLYYFAYSFYQEKQISFSCEILQKLDKDRQYNFNKEFFPNCFD